MSIMSGGRTQTPMKPQMLTSTSWKGYIHDLGGALTCFIFFFWKSVTYAALFFSDLLSPHSSESQSITLHVEYAFTHHWFLFSLSSATLVSVSLPLFLPLLWPPTNQSHFVLLLTARNKTGENISTFLNFWSRIDWYY